MVLASIAATGLVEAQRGDQRGDPRGDQRGDQRGTGAVGITIYAEPGFRGQSANFRTDVSNLLQSNMNDRVDSLQVGRGEIWEVCQDKDFRGRCQVFSGDQADLGPIGWAGTISSLRRLRDDDRRGRGGFGPPPPMRPRLVLFDDTGFRGRSFVVDTMTPTLRALSNRAGSAKVYGGAWELCDGAGFRGRCQTVGDSVPDLARIGLRDRVSSARPVGRGQGGRDRDDRDRR
jgi:hypothetical protein